MVTDQPIVAQEVVITGPTRGLISTPYAFTATLAPITATLPITYVWDATGQLPMVRTASWTDTVALSWNTIGTQTITSTAVEPQGAVTGTYTILIVDQGDGGHRVYVPSILRVSD